MSTIKLETDLPYWKERVSNELPKESIEIIEKFDNELSVADYSPNTRNGYLMSLFDFTSFMDKPLAKVDKDDFISYFNHLKHDRKLKPSSRKVIYQRLSKFLEWFNPKLDVSIVFPKSTKEPNETPNWADKLPTMDEIQKMIDSCEYIRDRALIALAVESGARINEILRMTYKDVNVNENYIRITLRGRTQQRDIPIVWSSKYLMQWIDQHPTKEIDAPLWTYLRGRKGHLNYSGAYRVISNAAKRTGLEKHINPHLFRHLRATILAKDPSMTTQVKKRFLGHSKKSNIFESVYEHLSDQDIIESMLVSYGVKKQDAVDSILQLQSATCPRCNAPVASNDTYCPSCWFILDVNEALRQEEIIQKQQEEIEQLRQQLADIPTALERMKTLEEYQKETDKHLETLTWKIEQLENEK